MNMLNMNGKRRKVRMNTDTSGGYESSYNKIMGQTVSTWKHPNPNKETVLSNMYDTLSGKSDVENYNHTLGQSYQNG